MRTRQRRRHEVLIGGTDSGPSNPPTPKFRFLLGFRSLYFENIEKSKILCLFFKKTVKIVILGGRPPSTFWLGWRVPPSPPPSRVSAPMVPDIVPKLSSARLPKWSQATGSLSLQLTQTWPLTWRLTFQVKLKVKCQTKGPGCAIYSRKPAVVCDHSGTYAGVICRSSIQYPVFCNWCPVSCPLTFNFDLAGQTVLATGRASPPGYGRAMGWAWAGCKILEINGFGAGPGLKFWTYIFLFHIRFSVENYQLFSAYQHNYQENITKHVKVSCFYVFLSFFKSVLGSSLKSGTFYM